MFERDAWRERGEFTDLPRSIVRRNRKRSPTGVVHGNVDELTDLVRRRTGDPDLTTSNVLGFLREHRRPTLADARRDTAATMHAELGDRLRDALGLLDVLPELSPTPVGSSQGTKTPRGDVRRSCRG
ncbi:MAG: hypothetical protein ACREM8_02970, partial [Vulcanimicrobiaceae bacterium]